MTFTGYSPTRFPEAFFSLYVIGIVPVEIVPHSLNDSRIYLSPSSIKSGFFSSFIASLSSILSGVKSFQNGSRGSTFFPLFFDPG